MAIHTMVARHVDDGARGGETGVTTPESPKIGKPESTALARSDRAGERFSGLLEHAKTPEDRAKVYELMDAYHRSKLIREAAKLIAETQWGRALSPVAQAAIANYALVTGTDACRHWMVLGGKLYDTAELYLDLCASQLDFNGYEGDDLTWNDGLDETEKARRRSERAKFGLPQDVKGACVVRLYRKGIDRPFIGANHAGNRVGYNAKLKRDEHKAAGDIILDPIGEQDPGKTAFTRAFRRAAKTAYPLWPFKRLPSDESPISVQELPPGTAERLEGRERVEGVIEQGNEAAKRAGPPERRDGWGAAPVQDPTERADPYPDESTVRAEDERLAKE